MSSLLFVPRSGSGQMQSLSVNFAALANQNPLDPAIWLNGQADGTDWSNMALTGGIAHGKHRNIQFSDPTAIAKGTWPANQRAQIVLTGVDTQGSCVGEAEIRLRSAVSPAVNRGYEIFYATSGGVNYIQVVRWNGPLGNFSDPPLYNLGSGPAPQNGYVLRAQMVGDVITGWLLSEFVPVDEEPEPAQIVWTDSVTDTDGPGGHAVFSDGAPGLGMYIGTPCLPDAVSTEHQFGASRFDAFGLAA